MTTTYKHIVELDGEVYVEGTRITVAQLVNMLGQTKEIKESDIERVLKQYPEGYLTKNKVNSALEYYSENRNEVATELQRGLPKEAKRDSKGNYFIRNE